jgi:hypothetical protein
MIKFAYSTHRFASIVARNEMCFPRSDEGFVGAIQSGECMLRPYLHKDFSPNIKCALNVMQMFCN